MTTSPSSPTAEDKGKLNEAIRGYLGMEVADCPEVWVAVKELREEPAFANGIRSAMRETADGEG